MNRFEKLKKLLLPRVLSQREDNKGLAING